MNGASNTFRVGETVQALRRDLRDEQTFHVETGTITRSLQMSPGWPYGLVVQFEDGSQEAFYFLAINLLEPRLSWVANGRSRLIQGGEIRLPGSTGPIPVPPANGPEPQVGDILRYRLRSNQCPTDPADIWRGRILSILINIADQAQLRHYAVQVLREGYVTDYDFVYPDQVVGFTPAPEPGPPLLIPPSVGPGPDMRG